MRQQRVGPMPSSLGPPVTVTFSKSDSRSPRAPDSLQLGRRLRVACQSRQDRAVRQEWVRSSGRIRIVVCSGGAWRTLTENPFPAVAWEEAFGRDFVPELLEFYRGARTTACKVDEPPTVGQFMTRSNLYGVVQPIFTALVFFGRLCHRRIPHDGFRERRTPDFPSKANYRRLSAWGF
jgi:hypothetical protein